MPSNYPTGLDDLPSPTELDSHNTPGLFHDVLHANMADAMEAVQGELGLTPSGDEATVGARIEIIKKTIFNPMESTYGATGLGSGDDGPAINAAIADASAAGAGIYESGAKVWLPSGRYRATTDITPAGCVTIEGNGPEASVIELVGGAKFGFTTGTFLETQWYMTFRDFTVRGQYVADSPAFDLEHTSKLRFERVYLRQFDGPAAIIERCIGNRFDQCEFSDNDGPGIRLGPISGPTTFDSCTWRFNNGWPIEILGTDTEYVTGVTIINPTIERNLEGALKADFARGITVIGGHVEVNHQVNTTPPRGTFTEPAVGLSMQFGADSDDTHWVEGVTILGTSFGDILPTSDEGYHIDLARVDGAFINPSKIGWATKAIRRDANKTKNIFIMPGSMGPDLDIPEDNGLVRGRPKDATLTYLGVPGQLFHSVTTFALTADVTYYEQMFVERTIHIDRLNIGVTTLAGAGQSVRLAIYRADENLQPTELVLDAGDATTEFVQQVSTTVNVTLTPGRYLLAMNASAAVTLRALLSPAHPGNNIASATCLITSWRKAAAIATFPDPGTAWDTTDFVSGGDRHCVIPRVSVLVDQG